MRIICLLLYYGIAQYLPDSYLPFIGKISNSIRIALVKHIFKKCGKISTINRLAYFGSGRDIEIGDYSGIGAIMYNTSKYDNRKMCNDGSRGLYNKE